ncbi:MAG: YidH family protein [Pseudanabaenaceae cyanobacterium]|jgi:putative membrane protein
MQVLSNSKENGSENTDKPKKYNSSRIRDHLANERTYLAWMRTAIALMGFGVVILRMRAFHPPLVPRPGYGWKLGFLFAIVGLITVLLSTRHYFNVRQDIDEDTYQPPDRWVILFSLAVTLLGTGIIYFVCASSGNPAELMVFEDFS